MVGRGDGPLVCGVHVVPPSSLSSDELSFEEIGAHDGKKGSMTVIVGNLYNVS